MSSFVPSPSSSARELLIIYGKHKYKLMIGGTECCPGDSAQYTIGQSFVILDVVAVKRLLCEKRLAEVPAQWVKLLAKQRAKEQ